MMVVTRILMLCCLTWLSLSGCDTDSKPPRRVVSSKEILAQVGEHVITKKDLQQALLQMSPYMRNQYTSFARRKQLLMQLVEFEVLVLEARQQNLQETTEVQNIRKRAMAHLLLNRVVQKVRPVDVSDAEIYAYFKKYQDVLKKPLADLQESIRHQILQKKRKAVYQAFVAELRKKYKVEVNASALAAIPMIRKTPTSQRNVTPRRGVTPRRDVTPPPARTRRPAPVQAGFQGHLPAPRQPTVQPRVDSPSTLPSTGPEPAPRRLVGQPPHVRPATRPVPQPLKPATRKLLSPSTSQPASRPTPGR